jgi:hypothetical protein
MTNEHDVIEYADGYNVFDGTGEHVNQLNCKFQSIIQSARQQYKQAPANGTKKQIAEQVYKHILDQGGNFYSPDGSIKSESLAVQKIQKSLEDMHGRTNINKGNQLHQSLIGMLPETIHPSSCIPKEMKKCNHQFQNVIQLLPIKYKVAATIHDKTKIIDFI